MFFSQDEEQSLKTCHVRAVHSIMHNITRLRACLFSHYQKEHTGRSPHTEGCVEGLLVGDNMCI